jgi:hypothetical protein
MRDTRVDETELEQSGERVQPQGSARICPKCDSPKIDGECEC